MDQSWKDGEHGESGGDWLVGGWVFRSARMMRCVATGEDEVPSRLVGRCVVVAKTYVCMEGF